MDHHDLNGQPSGTPDVNRLRAYLFLIKDIWSTFGLPTIILVIMLLLWVGVIPSPMSEAKATITEIKVIIERHVERDKEIVHYMKEMCISNAKLAHTPIEECLWHPPK